MVLRDQGATREQLEAHIEEEVPGILVKAAARRWLARQFDDPPTSTRFGDGGGPPPVRPIEKRTLAD